MQMIFRKQEDTATRFLPVFDVIFEYLDFQRSSGREQNNPPRIAISELLVLTATESREMMLVIFHGFAEGFNIGQRHIWVTAR